MSQRNTVIDWLVCFYYFFTSTPAEVLHSKGWFYDTMSYTIKTMSLWFLALRALPMHETFSSFYSIA